MNGNLGLLVNAAVALLVHGLAYVFGAWMLGAASHNAQDWVLWYLVGALALVMTIHFAKLRIKPVWALQVLFFAALIALWFWGANFALDALGNSVQGRRTPSHLQEGLPLHFILVPGVASVALALYASTFVRQPTRWEILSTHGRPERQPEETGPRSRALSCFGTQALLSKPHKETP